MTKLLIVACTSVFNFFGLKSKGAHYRSSAQAPPPETLLRHWIFCVRGTKLTEWLYSCGCVERRDGEQMDKRTTPRDDDTVQELGVWRRSEGRLERRQIVDGPRTPDLRRHRTHRLCLEAAMQWDYADRRRHPPHHHLPLVLIKDGAATGSGNRIAA